MGDTAREEVVSPVELVVFDAEGTRQARSAEALRVAPVFRFDPGVAVRAELDLRRVFADARRDFLDLVEAHFRRRLLTARELSDSSFAEVCDRFRSQGRGLPLSRSLAELWALGDSGEVVRDAWQARLSVLAGQYVRDEEPPAQEELDADSVRVITVLADGASLDRITVEKRGRTIARTNLLVLASAQQKPLQVATSEGKTVLSFLATFLRPNCVFDAELTEQARAKRIEAINVVDHYAAGQVIVRRGQRIDARIERALAELQSRTEAQLVRATAEEEKSRLAAEAKAQQAAIERAAAVQTSSARQQVQAMSRANKRLLFWIAFTSVSCVLFAGLWLRRRSQIVSGPELLPVRGEGGSDSIWRERALVAEARAEKAASLLRARVLPHLARWLMNEMWHRLLRQRGALLRGREEAERELAELAGRLDLMHAPLEERLQAYEQRIAELEAQLALKDQQNQELIRARLEWTRRKLDEERSATGGEPEFARINETGP